MPSNQYTEFPSAWPLEQWQAYCPNLTYRLVYKGEYPHFLPSGITDKFNCAVVMASGNATNETFVLQGFRVDDTALKEHQYIVTFDRASAVHYAGFIHHADYSGRTSPIPTEMLSSISLSGVNVSFEFPRKPPHETGTLGELISKGLISGFANSTNVQNKQGH